jgi:hypothetical protein
MDHRLVTETAQGLAERQGVDHAAAGLGRMREDRDAQTVDHGTVHRGASPARTSREASTLDPRRPLADPCRAVRIDRAEIGTGARDPQ